MEPAYINFNINNYVRVRLTERGRQHLRERHRLIFAEHADKFEYIPPTEIDGWSEWQLWDLMGKIGDLCHLPSSMPPIESDIQIVVNNLEGNIL